MKISVILSDLQDTGHVSVDFKAPSKLASMVACNPDASDEMDNEINDEFADFLLGRFQSELATV